MHSQKRAGLWFRTSIAALILGAGTIAIAAPSATRPGAGELVMSSLQASRAARISAVLDRWQAAAQESGQNVELWRDVMAIQFSQMTDAGFAKVEALEASDDMQKRLSVYRQLVRQVGADAQARYTAQSNGQVEKHIGPGT